MSTTKVRRGLLALHFAGVGLVFLLDMVVPLGVAVPIVYVLFVSTSGVAGPPWVTWVTTALCAVFCALGFFVSPPPGAGELPAVTNRAFAVFGIGVTAWLTLQLRAAGYRAARHAEAQAANEELTEALRGQERLRHEERRRARVLASVMEDLKQQTLRLGEEVRERCVLNDSLEDSNRQLRQFAYVASHDLQTPLRGISGFAQLLSEDYGDQLTEEARSYIARIVRGVDRMQTLIDDLLAYSRVDSRGQEFVPVDLNAVFDETRELMREEIAGSGAQVTRGPLPTILGDRAQIGQLLQNLIGNGVKYGGEEPRVHASAECADGQWTISVTDTGIGIAPHHHERIFEIFRRLHGQDTIPGTGIGLAVCRRVVMRHGGRIWVESDGESGSTFRFTIPKLEKNGR